MPQLIKNDMEQLRKLFIMPDSPDKFIEFGQELLDLIHNFFKEKGGIHSAISLVDLAKIFSDTKIPENPKLLKNVLTEIKNKIIAHSVKVGSPYYVGHMTSAIPYFMILLEMIIATLNQNQVKIESAKASTFVEKEFISWMHKLIFHKKESFYKKFIQDRETSLGTVTLDGTMANLTAILVARNKAFKPTKDFPGIRRSGLSEALRHYGYTRAVVLISKRAHYSFSKIARIIGIGSDNVIKIPTDLNNKMDLNELEKICQKINKANQSGINKTKILAIVAIAGNTETGNIDNLKEVRRIAKENSAHYHVDAAWGGAILLADDYRYLLKGIEQADSVTLDAHKLLYSPVSLGMVLFRKENDLKYLLHNANYIIRTDSVDLGRFTIEGSRSFSILKPWATLKVFGRDGFRLLFEYAFELTSLFRGLVERHSNFEMINNPELFIINYRFIPKRIQEFLETTIIKKEKNFLGNIKKINNLLNELNIELHKDLREEDNSFVSRTMIDAPKYFYNNIVILRSILVNPLTTSDILKSIINKQNELGFKLYKNRFLKKFKAMIEMDSPKKYKKR